MQKISLFSSARQAALRFMGMSPFFSARVASFFSFLIFSRAVVWSRRFSRMLSSFSPRTSFDRFFPPFPNRGFFPSRLRPSLSFLALYPGGCCWRRGHPFDSFNPFAWRWRDTFDGRVDGVHAPPAAFPPVLPMQTEFFPLCFLLLEGRFRLQLLGGVTRL